MVWFSYIYMYSFQEEKAAFVKDYTEYTISKLHSL